MHYFKRNIGDYAKKAGRLSMLQHGAYTLLLDSCYDRERFPTIDEAIEWTWASTKEEIEAVTFVLRKFFTLENEVYIQKRIQEEIDEYHEKAKTNKRIAIERETKRKTNSTLRVQGVYGSPPNQRTINQEPRTINQEPLEPVVIHTESIISGDISDQTESSSEPLQPENNAMPKPGVAGLCCKSMMKQGIQRCNPHHPTLQALLQAGASEEEFAHAASNAVAKGKADFSYVLGTVKRQREEAAKLTLHKGRMPNAQEELEKSNRVSTQGWIPPELRS